MKKILIFSILLTIVLLMFVGCDLESGKNGNIIDANPIKQYDHESIFYPDSPSSEDNNEEKIIFKDKKYKYEDSNVVILSADNRTSKNYCISVEVVYLDESGKSIKTETQAFDQLASTYNHYFVFKPNILFHSFTYTFKVEETDKTMYILDIEIMFDGLKEASWPVDSLAEKGDMTPHPQILSLVGYKNTSDKKELGINAEGTVVLLNESDDIISIYTMRSTVFNTGKTDFTTYPIYYTIENELTWPDTYKGEIRALHATTQCTAYN